MIYRDVNTLWTYNEVVGSVTKIIQNDNELNINGFIEPEIIKRYNLDSIIFIDGADRFITGVKLTSDGNWFATIKSNDIGKDNSCLILQVYAANENSSFIYPLKIDEHELKIYSDFVKKLLPADSKDIPSISSELKDLIIKATKLPYIARSIFQSIETGNNYQSLDLGKIQQKGGRPSRERYLSQIDFRGKTVLDIGANTGENSRIVRKLGASLVDGIEYDPFFVELGRAINAVSGMTRVSLFQGDCTKPELFSGMKYDIVLALAVWVYLQDTMKQVAEITDTLVFETHTLDHGMEFYYSRVLPYFPNAIALGYTEKPKDPHKSRMFVVFGKNREKLNSIVKREFLYVKPYFTNQFIKSYGILNKGEIFKLANNFLVKHSNPMKYTKDDYRFGAITYFEIFLAGLAQYLNNNKKVDSQNIYFNFLKNGVQIGIIDQMLTDIIENDNWAIRKVTNKYEDALNIIDGNIDFVPPVEIKPDDSGPLTFTSTNGNTFKCHIFDGHHRFFMCELAGIDKIHYKLIQ